MPARPVVAIFGPTAAGKSALALALAEHAGGEVVSADSMQLYRGLPVLTAQPTARERARVPHHLVGVWPLDHDGSVGEYAGLAHAAIDGTRARGRLPVVAGGTGLYLRAALAELALPPAVPQAVRASFERLYDERGPGPAHALLAERDPRAAARIHPNDRRRVVRALELHDAGGSLAPADDRLWAASMRAPTVLFTVDWEPEALAARIEDRTHAMLAGGAVEEVQRVLADGPAPSATASRLLGLAEVVDLVQGRTSEDECAERIAARTRRYARRQRIWLRKIPARIALPGADGPERNAERILAALP